jgi:hypothetical protein
MGGYSLYNWTYYPQISLLIYDIENWNLNNEQLLNFIDNLKHQKLKDIQIIFLLNNQIGKEYEKIFVFVGYHDDVWPDGNNIV